jgi:hypothetical protein
MIKDEEKSTEQLIAELNELRGILSEAQRICAEQQPTGLIGKTNEEFQRQVRERECAEEALTESEERYRLLWLPAGLSQTTEQP